MLSQWNKSRRKRTTDRKRQKTRTLGKELSRESEVAKLKKKGN